MHKKNFSLIYVEIVQSFNMLQLINVQINLCTIVTLCYFYLFIWHSLSFSFNSCHVIVTLLFCFIRSIYYFDALFTVTILDHDDDLVSHALI